MSNYLGRRPRLLVLVRVVPLVLRRGLSASSICQRRGVPPPDLFFAGFSPRSSSYALEKCGLALGEFFFSNERPVYGLSAGTSLKSG